MLDRLLAIADPGPADACVDLGAGTGFVALALAPLAGSVLAVDISPVMAESLAARAAQAGLRNVRTEVADLRTFRMPAASVDLVVSSYALHHLGTRTSGRWPPRRHGGCAPGAASWSPT